MNASLLILTLVIVVLAIGAVLLVLPGIQLSTRAKRDHRCARGTQHRQQIEQALTAIRVQVGQLQSDLHRLEHQMAASAGEESQELDQALARHLVSTKLVEVPGVGRARAKAITDTIFRRQLSDLHSAHHLPGIGRTTQAAISTWVDETQSQWPDWRSTPFPGKQQILDRYSIERRGLEQQRKTLARRITTLQDLELQATSELQTLSQITVADFRRALLGREERKDAEDLQRYILGSFPPWDTMPSWYAELLNAAEGAKAHGRVA